MKLYSLEQDESEPGENNRGVLEALSASADISDDVLFEVGLTGFLEGLDGTDTEALGMRVAGYTYKEIGRALDLSPCSNRYRLKAIVREFIERFELPGGLYQSVLAELIVVARKPGTYSGFFRLIITRPV